MARVFIVLVTLVLVPLGSFAQFPTSTSPPSRPAVQPPARDTLAKPATARIRGRVAAADTGDPIRRAQVRLTAPELRESRVATTDAQGRYELTELPAGRYQLTASKGSFVTISYGQTRPFQPGRPLELGQNQTIERIDFSLPRGSVITGTVVDEYGDPVTNAYVTPLRMQYSAGQRRPMPFGPGAQTNDIGEFRMFGLPPGQYYVSASMRGLGGSNEISTDRTGYAPTFYPGTANVAEAQFVSVGLGETRASTNVVLAPVRVSRIAGTIVDADGQPARSGMLTVIQRSGATGVNAMGTPIRPDGSFSLSSVAPGDYTLRAQIIGPGGPMPGTPGQIASADVTVTGEDITGIVVAPPRLVKVSGRVVLPGGAGSLPPSMIRVSAMPAVPEPFMPMSPPAFVKDDYSFELQALPGLMVIRAAPASPTADWMLKTVRVNGSDVTDRGIEFRPGQHVDDVEVEMTNTPPEVSGVMTNDRGEAVQDYSVLLFAQDRERWTGATRHVATARPDQQGRFKVRSLPPGQYYAIALEYMDLADRGDPEFLERAMRSAVRFPLGEAETKVLDLKLSALP
jgi:hypothetical protein